MSGEQTTVGREAFIEASSLSFPRPVSAQFLLRFLQHLEVELIGSVSPGIVGCLFPVTMAHHGHHREEYEEDEERREEKHHHGHKHHDEEEQEERYSRREEEFVDERRPEVGYGRRTDTYEVTEGGGYGGGQYGAPMTTHTTQVSEAEMRLDGIQKARTHETTYQRTEYAGAAGAALGAGLAMVSNDHVMG